MIMLSGNSRIFALALLFPLLPLALSRPAHAVSCVTQAAMPSSDRDLLATVGTHLANAAVTQEYATLKSALLPAVSGDWENIHSLLDQSTSLLQGGKIQINNLYVLDAPNLPGPSDVQFFCTNSSGSLTVTVNMHSLPAGRYALVLAEATGSPWRGLISLILVWDHESTSWKLGGVNIHPGALAGNDGVWYWSRARELARQDSPKYDPWSSFFTYELARSLLQPVDFLSSPNLDKLEQEESQLKSSPQQAFPLTLTDGPRNFKVESIMVDPTLLQTDLAVVYDANSALTDPAAQRTEAIAVLSALLKAQPSLRQNFHGLWALALKDGKRTPVLQTPMEQIP
jgi:hypothetical protein